MDPRVMKFANMPGASSHCPWFCNNTSNELIGYIKALIHSEFSFHIIYRGCWIIEINYNSINLQIEVLLFLIRFLNRGHARTRSPILITVHDEDLLCGDSGWPAGKGSSIVVAYPWPGVYWGYLDHVLLICSDYTSHQPQHIITALHHSHSQHQHHCTSKSHLQPNIFIGSLL